MQRRRKRLEGDRASPGVSRKRPRSWLHGPAPCTQVREEGGPAHQRAIGHEAPDRDGQQGSTNVEIWLAASPCTETIIPGPVDLRPGRRCSPQVADSRSPSIRRDRHHFHYPFSEDLDGGPGQRLRRSSTAPGVKVQRPRGLPDLPLHPHPDPRLSTQVCAGAAPISGFTILNEAGRSSAPTRASFRPRLGRARRLMRRPPPLTGERRRGVMMGDER